MFKKNYTDAFEHITPDDALKSKILERLDERENKKHNAAIPWRVGFAVAAAAAIALSVIFIPKNDIKSTGGTQPIALSATGSYNEIYKMMSKYKTNIKVQNILNGFNTKNAVDEEYIMYESATDMDGAASDIKGNASSNQAKQETYSTTTKDDSESERGGDFSETTAQVEGVKEADIVKTDGKHIFALYGSKIRIYDAKAQNTKLLSTIELKDAEGKYSYGEMFLNGNYLTLMQTVYYDGNTEFSSVVIYDIKNPETPVEKYTCRQQGTYSTSRMIGKYVYIITNCNINPFEIKRDEPSTYVPSVICKGESTTIPADSIYCYDKEISSARYTVIGAYDVTTGELSSSCSLLGGTDNVYCSAENIITANAVYCADEPEESEKDEVSYNSVDTALSRIAIKNGKLEYKCSGTIGGALENQFFIDEYDNTFRFVTTVNTVTRKATTFANSDREIMSYSTDSFARLTVLDRELKEIGRLDNVAKGERVYSVRFMGDTAYFVTFRQTDPLFAVDLKDPKNPKILSALKIPGFSEYMYPYGDGLLLGFGMEADEKTGRTSYLKLSMFDISDPADVTEQDKTVLNPFVYSEALYNHKAMLVSKNRNLIGFAANDNNMNVGYMLYEYTGEGFHQKAAFDLMINRRTYDTTNIRGLFIDNYFYVVNAQALWCFDLNTMEQLALIK